MNDIYLDPNEVKRISRRYRKFGVTEADVRNLALRDESAWLYGEARLIGVRMVLGSVFNVEEYFSTAEAAHVLGCSEEEAEEEIKKHGIETQTISIAPWLERMMGQ